MVVWCGRRCGYGDGECMAGGRGDGRKVSVQLVLSLYLFSSL